MTRLSIWSISEVLVAEGVADTSTPIIIEGENSERITSTGKLS